MIYYDGREMNKCQELADVLLANGFIPRYKSDGTLDPKGRNYRFEYEDEILEAKKRDDVYPALEKCPKIQQYFIDKLQSGELEPVDYDSSDNDIDEEDYDNMSEEDFLKSLQEDENISNDNEAEETESFNIN